MSSSLLAIIDYDTSLTPSRAYSEVLKKGKSGYRDLFANLGPYNNQLSVKLRVIFNILL